MECVINMSKLSISYDRMITFMNNHINITVCPICKSKNIYRSKLDCFCFDCTKKRSGYAFVIFCILNSGDSIAIKNFNIISREEHALYFCGKYIINSFGDVYFMRDGFDIDGRLEIVGDKIFKCLEISDNFMEKLEKLMIFQ